MADKYHLAEADPEFKISRMCYLNAALAKVCSLTLACIMLDVILSLILLKRVATLVDL